MLCQSCKHCADGVGGNRKCYLNVDNPLPMPYIPYEERENCKWYEYTPIPSNRRYAISRCPVCQKEIPVMMLGNGSTERICEHCHYHAIM